MGGFQAIGFAGKWANPGLIRANRSLTALLGRAAGSFRHTTPGGAVELSGGYGEYIGSARIGLSARPGNGPTLYVGLQWRGTELRAVAGLFPPDLGPEEAGIYPHKGLRSFGWGDLVDDVGARVGRKLCAGALFTRLDLTPLDVGHLGQFFV
ncbi:MAG: hypothetical protein HY543_12250 [Deltaproteobacteria bacterium]|nr:hypothetical protein [Deltaproteobacteria bacterium]